MSDPEGTDDATDDADPGTTGTAGMTGAAARTTGTRTGTAARSGGGVDAATRRSFWSAAVGVKVGLLGVSIGPLFAYFWGWIYVGAITFGVGVASFWHAYRTYREYVEDDGDPETADVEEEVVP